MRGHSDGTDGHCSDLARPKKLAEQQLALVNTYIITDLTDGSLFLAPSHARFCNIYRLVTSMKAAELESHLKFEYHATESFATAEEHGLRYGAAACS